MLTIHKKWHSYGKINVEIPSHNWKNKGLRMYFFARWTNTTRTTCHHLFKTSGQLRWPFLFGFSCQALGQWPWPLFRLRGIYFGFGITHIYHKKIHIQFVKQPCQKNSSKYNWLLRARDHIRVYTHIQLFAFPCKFFSSWAKDTFLSSDSSFSSSILGDIPSLFLSTCSFSSS